jgi:hypothetical protein
MRRSMGLHSLHMNQHCRNIKSNQHCRHIKNEKKQRRKGSSAGATCRPRHPCLRRLSTRFVQQNCSKALPCLLRPPACLLLRTPRA